MNNLTVYKNKKHIFNIKTNGFTLIELLSVIIVLAIISLITSLIVSNAIENVRKNSAIRSAEQYVNAINLKIVSSKMANIIIPDENYKIRNDGNLYINDGYQVIIETTGKKPTDGLVIIKDGVIINSKTIFDNYVINYDGASFDLATKKETITGTDSIILENKGLLYDYKIYGNSTQDGTPTPNTPIEVVSLGEPRNLFNIPNGTYTSTGIVVTVVDNNMNIVKTGTNYGVLNFDNFIKISANQTITFSVSGGDANVGFRLRNIDSGTYIDIGRGGTYTPSFDVDRLQLYTLNIEYTTNLYNMQIERGSTATDYEPYRTNNQVNVITSGKNLFDGIYELGYININTGINALGTIQIRAKNYIPIKPNTIYTISENTGQNVYGMYYDENYTYLGYEQLATKTVSSSTFTSASNAYYVRWYIPSCSDITTQTQLELGSTATIYEPYHEPITTTIDLTGHEPLRKIGDVSDYIDYENGKIIRNIGKVDLGDLNWSRIQSTKAGIYYFQSSSISNLKRQGTNDTLWANLASTVFINVPSSTIYRGTASDNTFGAWDGGAIRVRNDTHDNGTSFKSDMAGRYVYYELATPIEEDITLPVITLISKNGRIYVEGSSKIEAVS